MPIIEIELVCEPEARSLATGLVQELADQLGRALNSPPGSTWVRVRTLSREHYAENEGALAAAELPVFVTVLQARPPAEALLRNQVAAVTSVVARVANRPLDRVHVQYAPAAAGRQAIGGRLVE
ncbi:MAG TPA: hypothetical protein VN929_13940 [Burkholderiales bacterium]|nr:hypothetical protein [Burkholderiales bacterium]